jgi:hypothetical protein
MFPHVVLSNYRVSQMLPSMSKLGRTVATRQKLLAYAKFEDKVLSAGRTDPQFTSALAHEHYSTKMCIKCGTLNQHVGAATVFVCVNPACRHRGGRDSDAAMQTGDAFIFLAAAYYDTLLPNPNQDPVRTHTMSATRVLPMWCGHVAPRVSA